MTLVVRTATLADAADLSHVGTQSFSDAYRGTADDADIDAHLEDHFGEAAIRRELNRPAVRYLIADRGSATAGFAKLCNGDVPPDLNVGTAVEVQQLYVASDHQRSGVGGRLMDAALVEARSQHVDGVWLSAWTHADWAVSFYRGYGFEIVGKVPFRLGRTDFTDYLMWYELD